MIVLRRRYHPPACSRVRKTWVSSRVAGNLRKSVNIESDPTGIDSEEIVLRGNRRRSLSY